MDPGLDGLFLVMKKRNKRNISSAGVILKIILYLSFFSELSEANLKIIFHEFLYKQQIIIFYVAVYWDLINVKIRINGKYPYRFLC